MQTVKKIRRTLQVLSVIFYPGRPVSACRRPEGSTCMFVHCGQVRVPPTIVNFQCPALADIVVQQLIFQIIILANAGIHTGQYIGFHGCPIKEFGHDGNSKHKTL